MSLASARLSVAVLYLLSFCCFSATAQVSANLSGRVSDPTGAAVPAASVTANDLDTGASRTALTNQAGEYELFELPVGRYEVRAKKDGFAEKVRTGIVLVVGQDATADLTLQVGEVKQQVTVVENVPVVNASTQDISGLVGEQQVKELPLNGRSYRPAADAQPRHCQFHLAKDRRHRSFEFDQRGTTSRSRAIALSKICFC